MKAVLEEEVKLREGVDLWSR